MGGLDISFCYLACLVIYTVTEFIKKKKKKKKEKKVNGGNRIHEVLP